MTFNIGLLRRGVLLAFLVAGVAGCGWSGQGAGNRQAVQAVSLPGSLARSHTPAEYAKALVELQAAPVPGGVDAAQYAQLRSGLLDMLEARAAGKAGSAIPGGNENVLDDIAITDLGAGDYQMTWSYKNRGDYDLNGEVNGSDLTPIAQNFHATSGGGNWANAERADGDRNGEVNGSDVTPIGQHFLAQVAGYNIYGGASQTGPWTAVGNNDFSAADTSSYPPQFSYHIGAATYAWYLCVPRDFSGFDGVGGGGGGGGGATVTPGTNTPGPSATIGNGGGTLDGQPGTPLEGVHVTVPPGALYADKQITLSSNSGTVTPAAGTWWGKIIDVSAATPLVFDQPVLITLPFTGAAGDVPVPYYITPGGSVEVCQTTSLDWAGGKFTFMTLHTSLYTYFLAHTSDLAADYSVPGFDVAKDGFQITNWGSTYNNRGECFGMSAWTQWYFHYHKGDGDFYPRFMQNLNGLTGQDVIATRAFNSISPMWERYTPLMDWSTDGSEQFILIKDAIRNMALPTDLYIRKANGSGAHSILAYGWTGNTLLLCDPNLPPNVSTATLAGSTFSYTGNGSYSPDYTELRNVGLGSILRENFSLLLADAEAGFAGTPDCTITNLSLTAEDHVTTPNLTLTGMVTSGQIVIEEIEVDNGTSQIPAPVDPTLRTFSVQIPVRKGDNYLQFRTRGFDAQSIKVLSPNNYTNTRGLHFFGDIELTTLNATLTWDQPVDLDLYVTDPQNETAWYNSKSTTDGGELDIDVTGGYGPEHFTLTSTDTTRFGQDYLIKVHKYTSGDKFTNWTLKVSLNEGPPQTFTGSLTHGDSSNKDPGATGEDWGGFITIQPQQPQ
jgi:hypothetical protein